MRSFMGYSERIIIGKREFIRFYITLYPLCDILYTITNMSGINLPVNLNQMIRGVGLFFFFSCIHDIWAYLRVMVVFLWLLISMCYNLMWGFSTSLVTDFAFMLKAWENFVLFYAFERLYKTEIISFSDITDALIKSSYIVIFSILISYFGLGMSSYGVNSGRIGLKGLFTIQSTITGYLLLILPIYYYRNPNLLDWKLLSCIAALMSIGSKTGVFGSVLIYGIMFWMDSTNKKLTTKNFLVYTLIIALTLTAGVYYMQQYFRYLTDLYVSHDHYYSIEAFLLSNRNDYIHSLRKSIELFSTHKLFGEILGYGYSGAAILGQHFNSKFYAIERDFHGLYYYYGIFTLTAVIILLLRIVYDTARIITGNRSGNNREYIFPIIIFGGILYGAFGGHIFYEAMNQLPFWAVSAYIYTEVQNHRKHYNIRIRI